MELERKAYKQFENWKRTKTKQALLVTGARQIGKTHLIRKFCVENWNSVAEINFYENRDARAAISSAKNSEELFMRLTVFANCAIKADETVFFLDEIQEVPEIITAIKFLTEQGKCDFVLSGSMLGTQLKGIKSAPVGYLNTITMYPLDFEEYCWANGVSCDLLNGVKKSVSCALNCESSIKPFDDFLHRRLLELFHRYLISGGMPEPVKAFLESNDVSAVRIAQEAIVSQYKWDIAKYAGDHAQVTGRIFDLIPGELSATDKRFSLKSVEGDSHFNRYDNDFTWLVGANVALPVYNVREPRYPLLAHIMPNRFKLFMNDVGLLTYALGMDVVRDIVSDRTDINFGAIYENAVAQELFAHGRATGNSLFFYKKRNVGEIDFLITRGCAVVPIEVKSGKNYKRHVALNNLMNTENYGIEQAFVLSEANMQMSTDNVRELSEKMQGSDENAQEPSENARESCEVVRDSSKKARESIDNAQNSNKSKQSSNKNAKGNAATYLPIYACAFM